MYKISTIAQDSLFAEFSINNNINAEHCFAFIQFYVSNSGGGKETPY